MTTEQTQKETPYTDAERAALRAWQEVGYWALDSEQQIIIDRIME